MTSKNQERAKKQAFGQARTLYSEGLSGLLDVLDVQRSLLTNQLLLVDVEADAARAAIVGFEATGLIQETVPVQH